MDEKLAKRLDRIERLLRNPSSNPGNQKATAVALSQLKPVPPTPSELVCTKNVPFSAKLNPLQGVMLEEPCPLTGNIIEVDMDFPDNCAGNVEVQFGHRDIPMFPSKKGEYIALNATTIPFRNLKEPVIKGETLWAELRNGDSVSPHKPTVLCVIIGVE